MSVDDTLILNTSAIRYSLQLNLNETDHIYATIYRYTIQHCDKAGPKTDCFNTGMGRLKSAGVENAVISLVDSSQSKNTLRQR